jgi:hypothetical protein
MTLLSFLRPRTVEGAVASLFRSVQHLGFVAEVKALEAKLADEVAAESTKVATAARVEVQRAEAVRAKIEALLGGV